MDKDLYNKLDKPVTVGRNPKMTIKMAEVLEDILAELTEDHSYEFMTLSSLYTAVRLYWDEPWKDRDEG